MVARHPLVQRTLIVFRNPERSPAYRSPMTPQPIQPSDAAPRLIARQQIGDSCLAQHKAYPSTFRQARHEHPTASIDVVLAGRGVGDCGTTRMESVPGAIEFFPANTVHDFTAAPGGIRTLHIILTTDKLARAGVRPDLPGQRLPPERFARPCLGVLRALAEPDDAASIDLESCLAELLDLLADRARPRPASVHARRAARLLHDRISEALSLSEVADAVGLDPGHLARLFRRTHGVSIGVYQRGLRLHRAAEMLASGDEPIARIAIACGFADQAHLTNHFRRIYGITPARYRTLVAAA